MATFASLGDAIANAGLYAPNFPQTRPPAVVIPRRRRYASNSVDALWTKVFKRLNFKEREMSHRQVVKVVGRGVSVEEKKFLYTKRTRAYSVKELLQQMEQNPAGINAHMAAHGFFFKNGNWVREGASRG